MAASADADQQDGITLILTRKKLMRTKQTKDFTGIIENLTDLSEKDFREAIKIAKQFRKAQKSLQNALINQKAEPAGVEYELA